MLRRFQAAVICAILAAGCGGSGARMAEGFDPTYLAPPPIAESISVKVFFARYSLDEAALIETAWEQAEGLDEESLAQWEANGLRIAWADEEAAKIVRVVLSRAMSIDFSRRAIILSPRGAFEVEIGDNIPSSGLVYATDESTHYNDLTNIQLMMRARSLLAGADRQISVSPFFYSGSGRSQTTELSGAGTILPFADGGMIMIGPAKKPGDMRLGSMLHTTDDEGRWGGFVILEPGKGH